MLRSPIAVLIGLVIFTASNANAAFVVRTSAKGWPNGRTSSDLPPNAIDGNLNTFTWVTESFNFANPSFLGVGFDTIAVGRIRLWKSPDGGGGPNIKNLQIQYTNDNSAIALDSRNWQNVSGLTSGFWGTELYNASAVNANGTVTGDVHNSFGGDGWGSLSFDPVQATGIRIAFSNPAAGNVVHYRVSEFEIYTAVPEASSVIVWSLLALTLGGAGWWQRSKLVA